MREFKISFDDDNKFKINFSENVCKMRINFGEMLVKVVEIKPDIDYYDGPMEITPMNYPQEFETTYKVVDSNLKVLGVPYRKTMNPSHGNTITIGV